ncbi:MAG: PAS domain-containing protein [Niabella sp.]|nr:PAS domain-containing protein [Niabella sp.]
MREKTYSTTFHGSIIDKTLLAANIGTWQINFPDRELIWSEFLMDIFETGKDFKPDLSTCLDFFEGEKNRALIAAAITAVIEQGKDFCETCPIVTLKGNKKWLLITGSKAEVNEDAMACIYGIMQDVTESRSLAEMDKLENRILELYEKQELSVNEILSEYLKGMEFLYPEIYGSIHYIQDGCLLRCAAPSLPDSYLDVINKHPIGENIGSCGTAAYLKKPVFVNDIARAREWEGYAHLPLAAGYKACWSYPVIDSDNNVIAVLGMYYKEVQQPGNKKLVIIERAVKLLQLILESALKKDQLQNANEIMYQVQDLAKFGNWQWNMETNEVHWSHTLYNIYGVDARSYTPDLENYLAALHEADRQDVINTLRQIQQTGDETLFEHRIVRPDGAIRYLRCWARLFNNNPDAPSKMIGASLDITETKLAEMRLKSLYEQQVLHVQKIELQNRKLHEITWIQSHLVRAPLARIMAIADFFKNVPAGETEENGLLAAINESCLELDGILGTIIDKSEQIELNQKNEAQ